MLLEREEKREKWRAKVKNEGCIVWEKSFNIFICRGAFFTRGRGSGGAVVQYRQKKKKTLCAISRIAKILLTSVANYIIIIL